MKPLNINVNKQIKQNNVSFQLKPILAEIKDYSGQVYGDKLNSLYTLSCFVMDNNVNVSMIATDLIEHYNQKGEKGFWTGIGIDSRLVEKSLVYGGWGKISDHALLQPLDEQGEQEKDGIKYKLYYFDASKATDFDNTFTIVLNHDDIHYHYEINFQAVTLKLPKKLDDIIWNSVSVPTLKDNYLFGINLADPQGNPLPEGLYIHYLNSAVDYLQNLLDITISETKFTGERHDYIREDYRNWGFIQLQHNPIIEVKAVRMMYGNKPSIDIPLDWVQLNKLTGQITLFPAAGSANSLIIGQTGMLFGFQSQWDYAPMLWEVDYVAGIDEKDPSMPVELLKECVSKRAACGILNVWGDLIIGAGIASQSVSIDGLSQSIGTTQSAMFGGASARVQEYSKDIDERILPALRQKFGGIRMIVI